MTVHLIWAEANHRVIGTEGTLPWHLPEDLAHFRHQTRHQTVVMGRTTWESLPATVRPLPGRNNIVLSRNNTSNMFPGARHANTVDAVLVDHPEIWVIGGASIYKAFLPYAAHIMRTRIDVTIDGDTYAPALDSDEWHTETVTDWTTSVTGVRYQIEELTRNTMGV